MLERTVEHYRLINKPGQPEGSVPFRVAVLTTVLISVLAAVAYGGIGYATAVPVVVGIVIGSYFSYRTRNRANLGLKFVLSVLLLVVFVLFWTELGASIHDLRYPLIKLFLWLQALHSFDLPTRRDLDFSLISSAILIAFAGSMSISNDFLYVLIAFCVGAILSLYLGHQSALRSRSSVYIKAKKRKRGRGLVLASLVLIPVTLGFFMVLPRIPGFNSYYLPMTDVDDMPGHFEGLIKNPGYERFPSEFPSSPLPFDPDTYWGFNSFLDLRVRGVPSDEIVMKVRSPKPAYWRATAFDEFLGNGWMNTEEEHEEIFSTELPINVGYPGEPPRYSTRVLVQTYYIQRKLPNTLFSAYIPRDVFFPTHVLKVDSMHTVLTPVTLDPGLIYTVSSDISDVTPEALRRTSRRFPPGFEERYCQLPEMSEEVGDLARSITENETNDFDRVQALKRYLEQNYEYDLECPPQGKDQNTVEFFLFEEKRGYCEHFATSLAVMCRTLGIPARVAVGYNTGEYNALTGYYEVSARDAHAWVEVYFRVFGWIQFDPTPGWSDPYGFPSTSSTWSGFSILRSVGRAVSGLFPRSWGRALSSAGEAIGGALGKAFGGIQGVIAENWTWFLAVAGFLLLGLLWIIYRRRPGKEPQDVPPHGPRDPRQKAALLFQRMCDDLAAAGFERLPSQTPLEYCVGIDRVCGNGNLARKVAGLFNRARYSGRQPDDQHLEELGDSAAAVVAEFNRR